MKRALIVSSLLLTTWSAALAAQTQPYRVVFDLTSADTLDHRAVLRWIKEISAANPKADAIEVVMYGKGLEMVVQGRSTVADDVALALKNANVSFLVCQIAMKNNNVDKSQLLAGVKTVPDGIYEIFSKQRTGWGYVKVAH